MKDLAIPFSIESFPIFFANSLDEELAWEELSEIDKEAVIYFWMFDPRIAIMEIIFAVSEVRADLRENGVSDKEPIQFNEEFENKIKIIISPIVNMVDMEDELAVAAEGSSDRRLTLQELRARTLLAVNLDESGCAGRRNAQTWEIPVVPSDNSGNDND